MSQYEGAFESDLKSSVILYILSEEFDFKAMHKIEKELFWAYSPVVRIVKGIGAEIFGGKYELQRNHYFW